MKDWQDWLNENDMTNPFDDNSNGLIGNSPLGGNSFGSGFGGSPLCGN